VQNGKINQLQAADRAAHDWYRFVLSFPPHLVRDYLQRFDIGSNHRVLDPFCGTGTTLVECQKLGIPSVGVEANPMAYFASQVKVDWSVDPDGLITQSCQVAEAAQIEFLRAGDLRTLPDERYKLLLKHSISPLPLHKALVLLDCLQQYHSERYHRHQRLALAKALTTISNLHFGPEVGVGPIKADAPVLASWLANIQAIADDLRKLQNGDAVALVHHADSRQLLTVLEPESIDAVITSPPYPNEKDYTRTTRLELVLLGFIQSKAELQALKRGMIRSNTRGVYKQDDDDQWITDWYPAVQQLAEAIEARRLELDKTSGFERLYARVTKLYFGGMARHLADLRTVLHPGAQLAYVVGDQASYLQILIRTGELLAGIAQSLGYQLMSIDLFRTRLATSTKAQLREEVVVLRWPG